jgi:L-lactate dehydrogenase
MSTASRARRIAIVGSGMVGSTTAYALLLEGISAEIVLIDKNQSLAEGHADDLCDAQLFSRTARVFVGDLSDCATADVIIITAGVNQALMGNSRINDTKAASAIVKEIVDEIRSYEPCGVILVASNPLDVMTYAVGKWSGLPPNRVIGSGTSLDTSRFRRRLAQHFGIAPENVHAYIIGEHGDTQIPVLSSARIAGMSLEDFCRDKDLPYDESLFLAIANKTRTAGYAIQQAKGSTYYGIATALTRIVRAIWKDENTVLTVSRLVPPEFGLGDVCLSLPTTIGLEGAARPLNLTLSATEREALHRCADTLKKYIASIGPLAPQCART